MNDFTLMPFFPQRPDTLQVIESLRGRIWRPLPQSQSDCCQNLLLIRGQIDDKYQKETNASR